MNAPRKRKPKDVQPTREEVFAKAREGLTEALVSHMQNSDPKALFSSLVADIQKQRESLTTQLLGIEDRWGKLGIDHCNGRVGALDAAMKAAYQDQLMKIVREETQKTIDEVKKDKDHPIRQAIRAACNTKSLLGSYELRNHISAAHNQLAQDLVANEMAAIRRELLLGETE